jgi:glycosyltransferase involved in cell wall biosynthesis
VIPTWRRERVLVETVGAVLPLLAAGDELLLVDQTAEHEPATRAALAAWERAGALRRIALAHPSIPAAMNAGLLAARSPVALFLDDDVVPEPGLVAAHRAAHAAGAAAIVAGRVLQPWDAPGAGGGAGPARAFTGAEAAWVEGFMGGNFSVRREEAVAAGGFDERFVKAAYRFEQEFADRMLARGHRIRYEPAAGIRHLRAASGGTRALAPHWRNPGHGVGEYYYLLRSPRVRGAAAKAGRRALRSVATRYHLRRPWLIPVTLASEAVALLWAVGLRLGGPRLLAPLPPAGRPAGS